MANERDTELATEVEGERTAGEPVGCVVYVADGHQADRGGHIALTRGTVTVGTAADCDLQLHDERVSHFHLQLAAMPTGISVTDLDSTNGTLYLGNRIGTAVLKPGARLRIGRSVLALLPIGDRVEPDEATRYGELVGASSRMRQLFTVMRRLEESEAPVLIVGETGTGKELVARTLHDKGPRPGQPFAVLDCGAIPTGLLESEIFGHVRGAFTGATTDREGVFERARGGTVFLDEIGELPLEQQSRLLRVLESQQVRRVGGDSYVAVDARVIAATNRDLRAAVDLGAFREDLYYRLAVILLEVPPLRARLEDIPLLATELAAKLDSEATEPLPDSLLNLMSGHDWPGNVRELRNMLHRLISLGDLADPLPVEGERPRSGRGVDSSVPYREAREQLLTQFESEYVSAILKRHQGNVSQAARAAGMARSYFRELMQKHGLIRHPKGRKLVP